jgi:ElaB/YqjD/DUF883 family membrane-anchored ribosome-binding protein
MDPEPEEVIKQQMLETRASLAEKLETLEQQVVGTVHSASSAVTDTVDSVKEAVQETVELAKTSVHDTVDAVKDTFDLPRHVRAHPWIMVGGSISIGFAAGCLLERAARSAPSSGGPRKSPASPESEPRPDGELHTRVSEEFRSATGGPAVAPRRLLGELPQRFETELTRLKELALGTMLGIARDVITGAAPSQLSAELAEIIDSATVKLGGRPIPGPVLDMSDRDSAMSHDARWPTSHHRTGAEAPID